MKRFRDFPRMYSARELWFILFVAIVGGASGCDAPGNAQPETATVEREAVVDGGPSQLLNLDGELVDPFKKTDVKATVFLFTRIDCPISNRYAPEVKRLAEEFSSQGFDFWLVYTEEQETAEVIRRHLNEHGYSPRALRDPAHWLVRKAKATITPEAAVFVPGGEMVYRGRIDNWYVDFGKSRARATEHDLRNALEDILSGKRVRKTRTKAVGCYISD